MATGYFVISDITGYTKFLTESELEHANDIIGGIMKTISDEVSSPLQISNFQGDAILMYAPDENILVSQSLIHQIDNIYFKFRNHLQQMDFNTTCTCAACKNIPNLDLKFFVHHGEYAIQKIGDREELTGPDVILIHRMMKNDVKEKTGMKAYTLYTESASKRLNLTDFCDHTIKHTENLDGIGKVSGFVYCMHKAYQKENEADKNRVTVEGFPDYVKCTIEIEAPQSIVWDYLTKKELKMKWIGMNSVDFEPPKTNKSGYGVGGKYHCAHDGGDIKYEIMDWRPFSYFTVDGEADPGFGYRSMDILERTENGTRVIQYFVPHAKTLKQRVVNFLGKKKTKITMQVAFDEGLKALKKVIEKEHNPSPELD